MNPLRKSKLGNLIMTSPKGFDNKAVIYIRVSTDEQSREGVSLAAQKEKLMAYCRDRGLQVVEVIADEGVSAGKYLAARPGGARLLELVQQKKVTHVIATKLDRLFRNAADALYTTEDWDKKGISLHLLDFNGMTLDTSSPMGRMMLTVAAGFAELERNLCRQRTKDAIAHKKSQKQKYCRDVYGYVQSEDGTLTPDETEQGAIALIKSMRVMGASLRAIGNRLTELGYKTKRGGLKWYASTIKSILENDIHQEVIA